MSQPKGEREMHEQSGFKNQKTNRLISNAEWIESGQSSKFKKIIILHKRKRHCGKQRPLPRHIKKQREDFRTQLKPSLPINK